MQTQSALRLAALNLALGLVLAACGGDDGNGPNCKTTLDKNKFPSSTVSFATDIAPLFNKNVCEANKNCSCSNTVCHGATPKPESDFSTLTLDAVFAGGELSRSNGECTVVRGDPDASYMIKKLEGRAGERMPSPVDPRDSAPAFPQADIDTIRKWIREGAYP